MKTLTIFFFAMASIATAQIPFSAVHLDGDSIREGKILELLNREPFAFSDPLVVDDLEKKVREYNRTITDSILQLEADSKALEGQKLSMASMALLEKNYKYLDDQYFLPKGTDLKKNLARRLEALIYEYPLMYNNHSSDSASWKGYSISREVEHVWLYAIQANDSFYLASVLLKFKNLRPGPVLTKLEYQRAEQVASLDEAYRKHDAFGKMRTDRHAFGKPGLGKGMGSGSPGNPPTGTGSNTIFNTSIGGGLSGRAVKKRGKIAPEDFENTGKVVIQICVNSLGEVVSAEYKQAGSTTMDSNLIKIAIKAAKEFVFAPLDGPDQCGGINFNFVNK